MSASRPSPPWAAPDRSSPGPPTGTATSSSSAPGDDACCPGFSTARYCAAHAPCPVLVVPLPTLRSQPDVAVVDASEL
ncbi:hypothetical protein [Streptomyces sp. NBC_01546]|uniref:hypothetical protein n=1 Tax=Streptomyces sp. NBC_01546 TaxID=2975872 RepID=UPI00386EFB6E